MTQDTSAEATPSLTLRLAVVAGGLSQPSSTSLLADRLAAATRARLAAHGHDTEVRRYELRPLAVQVTNHHLSGFPSAELDQAIQGVTSADALIAVSPVFSASYSGLFKSFFDLLEPQALAGMPVLIGATGGTARHSLALEHAMRPLFAFQRAVTAPTAVFAATEDWGGKGDAMTESLPFHIDRAGGELAELAIARAAAPAVVRRG